MIITNSYTALIIVIIVIAMHQDHQIPGVVEERPTGVNLLYHLRFSCFFSPGRGFPRRSPGSA